MAGVAIRPLRPDDREAWLPLWHGYLSFYGHAASDEVTRVLWDRLFDPAEPVHGLVATLDEAPVGVTHYLFHRNTWMVRPVCYLQDLFTASEARGRGVGRALIVAVVEAARTAGSPRLYWMTHETNAEARALYDKVAERSGFIQYRVTLGSPDRH